MINYKRAKKIFLKSKISIKEEFVDSHNSLNRVCSKNIYSEVNYPTGNNAAFDGFAVRSEETSNLNKNDVNIIKKIIEKKGVKFLYNAIKGYFNYLLVSLRVRLINFLKAIGLYTFLKSIYNYLKK